MPQENKLCEDIPPRFEVIGVISQDINPQGATEPPPRGDPYDPKFANLAVLSVKFWDEYLAEMNSR